MGWPVDWGSSRGLSTVGNPAMSRAKYRVTLTPDEGSRLQQLACQSTVSQFVHQPARILLARDQRTDRPAPLMHWSRPPSGSAPAP